jgi:hypothetical protein
VKSDEAAARGQLDYAWGKAPRNKKKSVVYYGAHAIIDIGHAESWLDHVIEPQVAAHPPSRIGIAEGLLMRADASLDCFDFFDFCLVHARTLAPG